jgi:phosphomannomutase/phosphoglucomutase
MKDVIFREYDIRGIVDQEFFVEEVYNLTQAIIVYFRQQRPSINTIALGMDGRLHSAAIGHEMCRALTDAGINVLFLGVCPTPVLYFSLFTTPVQGGLMITASHNAKEYNGIKICLGTTSVWGNQIQAIKELYHAKQKYRASTNGTITDYPLIPTYVAWLSNHFAHLKGFAYPIIIDCGNGAAGTVLPSLLAELAWPHTTLLYPEVDGTYPNHEADPTVAQHMTALKNAILSHPGTLGIGLDGDCDRMIPMTKHGTLVSGDQLLALFAHPIVQAHPGAPVVFDVKSSAALIKLLEQWKAQPIMSPAGHSIIKKVMAEHQALIAGELSGHFFFKDKYFGYDDGIYALLRLCELLYYHNTTLDALLTIFPPTVTSPELRIGCPDAQKKAIVAQVHTFFNNYPEANIITIDGIRVVFPFAWGLIRPSNTQPMLSMRFESTTREGLSRIIALFYEALRPYLPAATLAPLTQLEIP